jgi:hypothetical protein
VLGFLLWANNIAGAPSHAVNKTITKMRTREFNPIPNLKAFLATLFS